MNYAETLDNQIIAHLEAPAKDISHEKEKSCLIYDGSKRSYIVFPDLGTNIVAHIGMIILENGILRIIDKDNYKFAEIPIENVDFIDNFEHDSRLGNIIIR